MSIKTFSFVERRKCPVCGGVFKNMDIHCRKDDPGHQKLKVMHYKVFVDLINELIKEYSNIKLGDTFMTAVNRRAWDIAIQSFKGGGNG